MQNRSSNEIALPNSSKKRNFGLGLITAAAVIGLGSYLFKPNYSAGEEARPAVISSVAEDSTDDLIRDTNNQLLTIDQLIEKIEEDTIKTYGICNPQWNDIGSNTEKALNYFTQLYEKNYDPGILEKADNLRLDALLQNVEEGKEINTPYGTIKVVKNKKREFDDGFIQIEIKLKKNGKEVQINDSTEKGVNYTLKSIINLFEQ